MSPEFHTMLLVDPTMRIPRVFETIYEDRQVSIRQRQHTREEWRPNREELWPRRRHRLDWGRYWQLVEVFGDWQHFRTLEFDGRSLANKISWLPLVPIHSLISKPGILIFPQHWQTRKSWMGHLQRLPVCARRRVPNDHDSNRK